MIKACYSLAFLLLIGGKCPANAARRRLYDSFDVSSYSFEEFVSDFAKSYDSQEEHSRRKSIFEENVSFIAYHNARQESMKGGHVLGINPFTDLRSDEIPVGYDKHAANQVLSSARRLAETNLILESVSDLPDTVNWRTMGVTTPVKTQGHCGSCWAFASVAVLESHLAIRSGALFSLSEQELVSCAPNPRNCGGQGGCTGATAQIAFDYVQQHGIVEEWRFGYQSYEGTNTNCSLEEKDIPSLLRGTKQQSPFFKDAVASIAGYVALENNDYQTLMNAVAKLGPVAVSVACSPWQFYDSGVFYAPLNTTKSTNINHLVVLEGYGTDPVTKEDYWLIRNSWGPLWGEDGYIRLRRVDPNTLDDPDSECGMDVTPGTGDGCTKDKNGRQVDPPNEKICGTSGVLYSGVVPLGANLISD